MFSAIRRRSFYEEKTYFGVVLVSGGVTGDVRQSGSGI